MATVVDRIIQAATAVVWRYRHEPDTIINGEGAFEQDISALEAALNEHEVE